MATIYPVYANSSPFVSGAYNPPTSILVNNVQIPVFSRNVAITVSPEYMKYVIGTKGSCFTAITKYSGAQYIWYHRDKGVIEVIGLPGALDNAEFRLKVRMAYISQLSDTQLRNNEWPTLRFTQAPFHVRSYK